MILQFLLLALALGFPTNSQNDGADMDYSAFRTEIDGRNSVPDRAVIAIGTLTGTFSQMMLGWMPGKVVAGALNTGVVLYATRNYMDPKVLYGIIWGKLQIQINAGIVNHNLVKMRDRLTSLSLNLHDQSMAYMSELGFTSNITDMLPDEGSKFKLGPIVTSRQVDICMKSFDDILSTSNSMFYNHPINPADPSAFLLIGSGIGCLHTNAFNSANGTELAVDPKCAMNSLNDKVFSVSANGYLLFRTNTGNQCVTYNSNYGNDLTAKLAVFNLSSIQCRRGRPIKLKKDRSGFSLHDGSNQICLGSGKNTHSLVASQGKHKCNNTLTFKSRLAVPLDGNNFEVAQSYEEIVLQVLYFPTLVSIHLNALKEMYLHGSSKRFAEHQYKAKLKQYQAWIASYLPVVIDYTGFIGLDISNQIRDTLEYSHTLQNASLEFHPVHIEFRA